MSANELGFDNLLWFMGVVEDIDDGQFLGRCKVRAFGIHPESKVDVPTEDLPWAFMIAGTYNAAVKPPQINSWVFGFFMDGALAQHPMLLGSMIGMPTTLASLDPNGGFGNQSHYSTTLPPMAGDPLQLGDSASMESIGTAKDTVEEFIGQSISDEDMNMLVRATAAEASANASERAAVAGVILNRVKSPSYPNTISGVLNQKNQFQAVTGTKNDPGASRNFTNMSNQTGGQVVGAIIAGLPNQTQGWLNFTAADPRAYGAGTNVGFMADVANADGSQRIGGTLFGTVGGGAGGTAATAGGGGGYSSLGQTSNPMCSSMFQPNLSGLARGEGIGNTYVPFSNAIGSRNGAPGSGYGAQYPYNWVHETESGHAFELDDTPGNERVSLTHKSGSQVEMDTSGRVIIKTTGDSWIIVEKNSTAKIRGDWGIQADGHVNITALNDMSVNCVGDLTTTVNGNYNLNVAGDYNLNVGLVNKSRAMEHTVQATQGSVHLDAKENIQVRSDKTMTLESGESLNLNVKAGPLNMKASGDSINMNSTADIVQTADTDVKIHSGGIAAITSETLLCLNSKSDLTLVSDAGVAIEADKIFNSADAFTVKGDNVVISSGGKLGLKGSSIELDTSTVKGPIPAGKGTAGSGSSVSTGAPPNKPDALSIDGDAALGQTELPKPPTRKVPVRAKVNNSSGEGAFGSSDDYGEGLGSGPTNTLTDDVMSVRGIG